MACLREQLELDLEKAKRTLVDARSALQAAEQEFFTAQQKFAVQVCKEEGHDWDPPSPYTVPSCLRCGVIRLIRRQKHP